MVFANEYDLPDLLEDMSELELAPEEQPLSMRRWWWQRKVGRSARVSMIVAVALLGSALVVKGLSGGPQDLQPARDAVEEKVAMEKGPDGLMHPIPPFVQTAPAAKPGAKPWVKPWQQPGVPAQPWAKPWMKPQPAAAMWCRAGALGAPPVLWAPDVAGEPVNIKVLSFNLYWWNLFLIRKGNGNSAEHLIQGSDAPEYDFMGFQECENLALVMTEAHLEGKYTLLQTEHSLCLAFKTDTWDLLSQGQVEVAEDAHPQYFGRRSVQWVRVKRKVGGKIVLFMNHHGPLPTNTGGICGGPATAGNILRTMVQNAKGGDAVILVGDFNSDQTSTEIGELSGHLHHVYNGAMNLGIDNIFTNIALDHVAEVANLGNGGSDHDAISATLVLGGPPVGKKVLGPEAVVPPGNLPVAGCQCAWANNPGSCEKTDGGSCWNTCCHPPADSDCDCKCDWSSTTTCKTRPTDGTCCWRKCCAPFV